MKLSFLQPLRASGFSLTVIPQKASRLSVLFAIVVMILSSGMPIISTAIAAYPETRQYTLGDIDNFNYGGAGSIDDVYVNPNYLYLLQNVAPAENNDHFDVINPNDNVPFTFTFTLSPGEVVVSATLELGLRAINSDASNDELVLPENDVWYINSSNHSSQQAYRFSDLGWFPISTTGTTVRSADISNLNGNNRLSLLQDGQFDVSITDDTAIDYAVLTIGVIPEPATLAILTLGGLVFAKCRK